ncbi:SDR family oxidoreductase [Novosphingobium sp. JCM 18896]|uniref:SDR family oxidoreductase n=1 Tax=Novosphingobium sp. JCM 18896 TaxID=2989731 RepID=UPI0022232C67|nr:SDR family oxidoreductase [Novosphingobium sp. JCM 18896]MCW1427600.1 SDR family oxidoreductase [Novosphingobium sp. JCM 18896]
MAEKIAFVTGAGSGIGRATARLFAERGHAVALVDMNEAGGRETEAMIREAGGEARFIQANVADDDSVRNAVEQTLAAYGRIDAAFNAAGIDGEVGKLTAEGSLDNWHRVIGVNLTGVWHCLRHQIPAMLATGGGAIVNCASTAGIRGAAFCGAYSASKHGVVGLTKAAALEYASQGIRINAVCPGMIETPMTQRPGMGEIIQELVKTSPLERIGQPQEIGAAVWWLCGPDASFVHGQAVAVDGALTSR